jgi:hypothetical protein
VRRAGALGQASLGVALAALMAALLSLPSSTRGAAEETRELRTYQLTEHAPIIRGRPDKAFQRALETSFRKALLAALRDTGSAGRTDREFAAWLSGILSRAADFIASYRILSHQEKEGYLTLTVEAQVFIGKLEAAVSDSSQLAPYLPVRLLVLIGTFPLAGTSGGEDVNAGHIAARALETEFLRRGAVIVPSPENLPWQHLGARATADNEVTLAAAEGRRLEADFVVLGKLRQKTDNLLVLSAALLSVSTERTVLSARSPVELQSGAAPRDFFSQPAAEIADLFERKLSSRTGKPH